MPALPQTPPGDFDPLRASEVVEACRAHVASLQDIASTTSQALHEFFEYDKDEPNLGSCIGVVHQLLERVLSALPLLGLVLHDHDPVIRAQEIAAGCEVQRLSLLGARHVTLAAIYVLKSSFQEPCDHQVDETLECLRDLEEGIRLVLDGFNPVTLGLPIPATN